MPAGARRVPDRPQAALSPQPLRVLVLSGRRDELLAAVDVVGRAGDARCSSSGGRRGRRCQPVRRRGRSGASRAARSRRSSSSSPSSDADSGVSTKPAAIRLTRTGASSSARLAVSAGPRRRERRDEREADAGRRPPVPPMKSSVPPGRTLPAACRAICSGSRRWRLEVAARLVEVELGQRRVVRARRRHHARGRSASAARRRTRSSRSKSVASKAAVLARRARGRRRCRRSAVARREDHARRPRRARAGRSRARCPRCRRSRRRSARPTTGQSCVLLERSSGPKPVHDGATAACDWSSSAVIWRGAPSP